VGFGHAPDRRSPLGPLLLTHAPTSRGGPKRALGTHRASRARPRPRSDPDVSPSNAARASRHGRGHQHRNRRGDSRAEPTHAPAPDDQSNRLTVGAHVQFQPEVDPAHDRSPSRGSPSPAGSGQGRVECRQNPKRIALPADDGFPPARTAHWAETSSRQAGTPAIGTLLIHAGEHDRRTAPASRAGGGPASAPQYGPSLSC
jgi:hypothetical protein